MTFRASMRIDADASDAKSELKATASELKKAGAAAQEMGTRGGRAAGETRNLGSAAGATAPQVMSLAAAERAAAASALQVANNNRIAAGSVGNLTAQFNDIGVMLAAGQNPLQLALQQGTQITQVIGPMGAAGAVKALGGAFLSMLNPLSLITIGSIAAGAALFGWLTGAGEEAVTFDDRLKDLTTGLEAYAKAAKAARAPTAELRDEFGLGASAARGFLSEQAELDLADLRRIYADAMRDIGEDFGGQIQNWNVGQLADMFDLDGWLLGNWQKRKETRALITDVIDDYNDLSVAADKSVSQQLAALDALYDSFSRAADASGGQRSGEEIARLQEINALRLSLQKIIAEEGRAEAELAAKSVDRIATLGNLALKRADAQATAQSQAEAMLATLNEETAIRAATLRYGAQSTQVANLRADAERRAFKELLATLDVSSDLKDELRAAFSAKQDIAALDIVGNISSAAVAAGDLAANLRAAAAAKAQLDATGPKADPTKLGFGLPGVSDPGLGGASFTFGSLSNYRRSVVDLTPPKTGAGRGGGGASAANAERKAVENLIVSLTQQLAVLHETDPVQKEMLKNREALKGATDAERKAVEALIRQRVEEERSIAAISERREMFSSTAYDGLRGLVLEGAKFNDVLDNMSASLLDAVLQASALGTGPLANLFGTAGSSGFLGTIAGALFPGAGAASGSTQAAIPSRAGGGMVYGPGDGTSDDVLMWGSSGEFMMNARSTKRYRHLLEAMNSGMEIPGFAFGGMIGGASAGGGGGVGLMTPTIIIENNGSSPQSGEIREESDGKGGRQFRLVLADEVGAAMRRPGSGARRTLEGYGVRPKGTRR